MRRSALVCACLLLVGLWRPRGNFSELMPDLIFLTRADCVATDTMRARFDEALTALGRPKNYTFVDADSLSENDPRRGYGTPTILYRKVDLFGMPEPPATKNAPT